MATLIINCTFFKVMDNTMKHVSLETDILKDPTQFDALEHDDGCDPLLLCN